MPINFNKLPYVLHSNDYVIIANLDLDIKIEYILATDLF